MFDEGEALQVVDDGSVVELCQFEVLLCGLVAIRVGKDEDDIVAAYIIVVFYYLQGVLWIKGVFQLYHRGV